MAPLSSPGFYKEQYVDTELRDSDMQDLFEDGKESFMIATRRDLQADQSPLKETAKDGNASKELVM